MIGLLLERWRPSSGALFYLIMAASFMAASTALGVATWSAAQPFTCEVHHVR